MQTSETIHPDNIGPKSQMDMKPARTPGRLQSWTFDPEQGIALLYGDHANLAIRFVSEEIIRVQLFEQEQPDWSATVAVLDLEQAVPVMDVTETETELWVSGAKHTVRVSRAELSFQLLRSDGEPVTGAHQLEWDRTGTRCIGELSPTAQLYGLGETTGDLNKRGEQYTMWNSDVFDPHVPETPSLYQSIPFLVHFDQGQSYGCFLDNPGKCDYDLRNRPDAYEIQISTGKLDMYLIADEELKQVLTHYTALTGRISMPPLWALGYHQSRYSYKSQEEVMTIARTFREKQIPCDVIYLDIHYMDGYRVFTFDKEQFPDPQQMMTELVEMGFRVVPIVDPGVKKDASYSVYREGIQHDYFCKKLEGDLYTGEVWPGESAFADFTKEEAARWWGRQHQYYTDMGISGIWNDMNEPSIFNVDSKTMDLDVIHEHDGRYSTHEEIHNLYGLLMSRATFLGLRELLEGERAFVLTRAGYAGIQRYAAVWTGDNRSYWEHLAMVMPMTLNLGLSGIPFCGTDIGGFAHHASGELVARWTQLGTFSPYCRNHSLDGTRYQEPWQFGEEIEAICKQYIELRYRWLPHLYSLFHEASRTGWPILRPLLLEFPQDAETYGLSDQMMVGSQVMIAPIYRPNTTRRAVYLPQGSWVDYWTGEELEGGQYHLATAPLDTMPIYIRGGAIWTEAELASSTQYQQWDTIHIQLYANGTGESATSYYEDDRQTYDYESGASQMFELKRVQTEDRLSFSVSRTHTCEDAASVKKWKLTVRHLPRTPQSVEGLEQQGDSWRYDQERHEVIVETSRIEFEINIHFPSFLSGHSCPRPSGD
ncbi:glycoside hydrolase family 31 protein [Marinicrinis sediminis]|uniref:TIM-barrel domain-containing protein n=1 Tax=Marinicrinis sediminis TaxID=1652465 RepID=A0ABW5R7K8_9BACL